MNTKSFFSVVMILAVLLSAAMTACTSDTKPESTASTESTQESQEIVQSGCTEETGSFEPTDFTGKTESTELTGSTESTIVTAVPNETEEALATEGTTPPETMVTNPTVHTHSYSVNVVQATCTVKGYNQYICACGYHYKDNQIDALGHNYNWQTVQVMTCAQPEIKEGTCTRCGVMIKQSTPSTIGHKFDDNGICSVCGSLEGAIPEFVTTTGKLYDVHDCGQGNTLLTYQDVQSASEAKAYETTLKNAGFTLASDNDIGDNRFTTFTKGDILVHCSYFKAYKEFRIVYGPKTYLGNTSAVTNYAKVVTPSVSIIGMTDSVLCMVVQLADGSFIIIDGGYGYSENRTITLNRGTSSQKVISFYRDYKADMASLYNFLKGNTPGGGKPQVTWMITHADPDHITLPYKFMEAYSGQFDLQTVCYNFPNMYNIRLGENNSTNPADLARYTESFINTTTRIFPNANHFIMHTGSTLYLPGCEIEFLFTASEDYYPQPMYYGNHTSNAWRMTIEGKTILFTGDIEEELCTKMEQCYGDYLKSDILQVVHHGSNGATLDFYKRVTPTVCFWPCKDEYLLYDLRHTGVNSVFNKYLHQCAAAHYSNGTTTTVLLPSLTVK